MKKTKSKKETEDYWQKEYWDAIGRYRAKLMFWKPLGMIALIGIIVLFLYVLVQAFPNTFPLFDNKYTITKTECHNETKQLPCALIEYHQKQIYACPQYYIEDTDNITGVSVTLPQEIVCNKTEVDKIIYISEDCVSHSPNQEWAILNCVSMIKKSDLNEGWLFSHCLSRCTPCEDLECRNQKCDLWKCGEFEVSVK